MRFLAFDLDLWPTTLTFNPKLAKVKVNLHTKFQGHRSIGSSVRAEIDGRTLPSTLSPSFAVDNNDRSFIWSLVDTLGHDQRPFGSGHYLRQGGGWNSENQSHSKRAPLNNHELHFCPPPCRPNLCTEILPPPLSIAAMVFSRTEMALRCLCTQTLPFVLCL